MAADVITVVERGLMIVPVAAEPDALRLKRMTNGSRWAGNERRMSMLCENCFSTMVFSSEVDYGDGDVRVTYICPRCGHAETIFE